jgi:Ras-related GTP-binding protein A/B
VFRTSIWDETLYRAWSQIAHFLIPRIDKIETGLKNLCKLCSADELVLFEKSTFLEISHIEVKEHKDVNRFEKISNIIKQFKLSLYSTNYKFQEMMVKNSKFQAYLLDFTKSTYVMIILSSRDVEEAAIKLNIEALKPHFDKLIAAST